MSISHKFIKVLTSRNLGLPFMYEKNLVKRGTLSFIKPVLSNLPTKFVFVPTIKMSGNSTGKIAKGTVGGSADGRKLNLL